MADSRFHDHTGDLALLGSVPALLLAVYVLPAPTRADLALSYAEPTLGSAYASHFVHLDASHLLANLVVYLTVVPVAYLLSVRAERRDLFRAAFATFLLVFPLALSGLNLLVSRPRIGFGFSGINMAFVGLLALLLAAATGRRAEAGPPAREGPSSVHRAPVVFLAGTGVIVALAVPSPRLRLGIAAGTTIAAGPYLRELPGCSSVRSGLVALARSGDPELSVTGLVVFVLVLYAAFPPSPADAGSVSNLYTHLLGYCLGFIAPYATVSILEMNQPWDLAELAVLSPDSPSVEPDRPGRR